MPAVKSGSSLQSLVLTPERIPSFLIPSRSPRLLSPDRTRLLSNHDSDVLGPSPPETPPIPTGSSRLLLHLPPPRIRRPRRIMADSADTDLTTRAAMSLTHVAKVTTPYGFRAVLAASPCTRRRESMFHRNKPVTMTNLNLQEEVGPGPGPGPSPGSGPSRSRANRALDLLKQPAAALKALSPATRRTAPSLTSQHT